MYNKLPAATNTEENIPKVQEHNHRTTEDINSLFSTYRGFGSYKILIEGEPGIGKTILSSEIATQWANKTLLDDKALLFLLFMRQSETKNISDVKSLVEHFFHDDVPLVNEITEWLINSNGKHLTIILDGYDEAFRYSAFFDFVNQLIAHETLPECGLVITSRPAESLHLHGNVNCRAEVLGFTEQSRQHFINLYIEKQEKEEQIYQTSKQNVIEQNIMRKIEMIQKLLKCNPIINTLCYIPLNITMLLLCLTESEEETKLPTTTTTLYERFIIITIKRFLCIKPGHTDTIFSFKDLPYEYYKTFQELTKFAYSVTIDTDGKKSMQLVFELADIETNCKNFISHSNGLGLLKPASFLEMELQNKYCSYNFLHKSIQEYMTAYYITSLPPSLLSNILNKTFWDSKYFNIWIMYVGITKGEQKQFKQFLSGSSFKVFAPNPSKISSKIVNNKIKCLHLLRCAAEARQSKLLLCIQNTFEEKVIDLSNKTLSQTNIKTLAVLLLDLPGGPWTLNLSNCNIDNKHCKVLFDTFTSQTVTTNIQMVNISFNSIYSENLLKLCQEIFKVWKTEEVVLPIDALHNSVTIKVIKNFMDTLKSLIQTYRFSTGKLMVMYQGDQAEIIIAYSDLKYIKCFQLNNCELNEDTAKRLKQSITEELKGHRVGHIYFSYSIYDHHDVETLSYIVENFKRIKFCGLNMHSKGAYLLDIASKVHFHTERNSIWLVDYLAAVLKCNTQVNTPSAYLSMLSENIKKELKGNLRPISTIKVLDLRSNHLSDCIADDIELILSYNQLEELYLGDNNLHDKGLCKIAEALQSNSILRVLDISSNGNISDEVVYNIATALANKTKLEKLYLNRNELKADGIVKIGNKLCTNSLKILNVSHNLSDSTAASTIQGILRLNTHLEELHLGGNILRQGITVVSVGLTNTTTLKVFDISNNDIGSEAADDIAFVVSKQVKLEKLILDGNNLQDGLIVITKALKCYSALKVVDISSNNVSATIFDKIAVVFCFQTKLQKLYLGGNNTVSAKTLQVLKYFLAQTEFDITSTKMSDKDILPIVSRHVVYMQMLFLAQCEDISATADKYDISMLPLPTTRMSVKPDKAKILNSAGKCY